MTTHRTLVLLAIACLPFLGCASDGSRPAGDRAEATSLLGEPLVRPALPDGLLSKRLALLEEAEAEYHANPESESAAIWYGRRLAYLGRYNDAVDVFTEALETHPESFRLRRHRGHRFITLREFDRAILDLTRAETLMGGLPDETEADGIPNAQGIPISSTRTNILYHLGLAHYLKGEFEWSAEAFKRCAQASRNDDNIVSSAYWLVLSQVRTGQREEAELTLSVISPNMRIIENHGYHRLLLHFKGELSEADLAPDDAGDGVQDATVAYGIAAWKLLNGEPDEAQRRFRDIVDAGSWAAFGHIAAEAELARMR